MAEGLIRTPDQRLRVFISSTLVELADERQAARSAVEQLRLAPIMFEIGARAHPPRALYRSYLAQSDVFVGVYWERYGWIAPDMEISGLEDELLLSDGMPRLIYVKRPAPDMESRLAAMLEQVADHGNVSYRPFKDPEELHELLLDDLAILLAERFDVGQRPSPDQPAEPVGPRHNLPAQTSSFVGREAELRELHELLADDQVRFVTLTGPGGAGKTRLAIEALHRAVGAFPDGVRFVDLSAERDADGAIAAIARVTGVTVPNGVRPLAALEEALRGARLCLLLDTFEQVLPAAIDIAVLLGSCPGLKVIVTSREALRVRGERVFPVPPLSLPERADLALVEGSDAVRLFYDRAQAAHPGFRLTADNAADVAAVCSWLDGLPLALELAAARTQLFDAAELRARLADKIDILQGGARDLPERQQTLRDAISWSYDLLGESERRLLLVLSVFSGGRLADIESTARPIAQLAEVDVVEAVASLVDKSLLRSVPGTDGRPRFSLLRTIRSYAAERLEADVGLAEAAARAHAEHYTEVARRIPRQQLASARSEILGTLEDELGNLRSAWDRCVEEADLARLNVLVTPLWAYYDARGDYRAATDLGTSMLAVLAVAPDTPERRRDEFAMRINVVRTSLLAQGFTPQAERMIRETIERAETEGDARGQFPCLRTLGYLHSMRAHVEGVTHIAGELMSIAVAEGDPALLSEAFLYAGLRDMLMQDLPAAVENLTTAVEHFDSTHPGTVDFAVGTNPGVVSTVVLALTQWMAGRADASAASARAAVDLAEDLAHPYSIAYALHHAALLDLWRFDFEQVGARADAVLELAEAYGFPTWTAVALAVGGSALAGMGDLEEGLARIDEGVELYQGLAAPPVFSAALLMMRARARGLAGRVAEALADIHEAEAGMRPGNPMKPDAGLIHGELLLVQPTPEVERARVAFEQVAELAAASGARMPEIQARTRLVEIASGTPGERDARKALREVYDAFDEGLDLPQLRAARAALDT